MIPISRRTLFTAAAAPAFVRAQSLGSPRKPNLLMLMADQHRADWVGAYGNSAIHTPNLDRLANGVKFTAAYSSTPTCTPARACLLTGMSPWGHGMLGYSRVARRYPVEMPRLLRDAGYYTTGIGKMHWTPQRNLHGFHQTILDESGRAESVDFRSDYRSWFYSEMPNGNPDATGLDWNGYTTADYALPERLHPTAWTGNTAVNFIRDYDRAEPFFLKVSFARPHSPYDPPKRLMDRYRSANLPTAKAGAWADRYRERNSDQVTIWHGELSPEQVQHSRRAYYANVTFIDEQIGRMLEVLDERRLLDNTVILYFSDHGDMLGDHHLWRKSYAYQASARIPMLLYASGLRGRTISNPVELRDVLPTLLDAAGVEAPPAIEGRSMLRLARDPQSEWRQWIDLEHDVCYSPDNHWNALTDGRQKYIYHAKTGEEQLFDIAAEPLELNGLSDDAALRLWRNRMIEHLGPRGESWVANGRLALRPKSLLHSPNYPKS